jgi:hypothetical protein
VGDAGPAGQVAQAQGAGALGADGIECGGEDGSPQVERRTDEQATSPWRVLGTTERERLVELLGPLWVAAIESGLLPSERRSASERCKTRGAAPCDSGRIPNLRRP